MVTTAETWCRTTGRQRHPAGLPPCPCRPACPVHPGPCSHVQLQRHGCTADAPALGTSYGRRHRGLDPSENQHGYDSRNANSRRCRAPRWEPNAYVRPDVQHHNHGQ